jgi:ATP-dependent Clp protease adaptor protein ClpS
MTSKETKKRQVERKSDNVLIEHYLILHNDNVHSFDYVINALIDICDHAYEQATQCAIIAHYKGKCDIKKGGFETLKPLKDALVERELNVTID